MMKSPRKLRPSISSQSDLDSWLFSSDLEPDLLTLLGAYRSAAEGLRQANLATSTSSEAVAESISDPADEAGDSERTVPRGLPAVPRLHAVPGIDADDFARLHGQLVANGFVTVEILGRTDGLAYRVTRDGLRQLDGEPAAEAA
jgi:hypothetical protein